MYNQMSSRDDSCTLLHKLTWKSSLPYVFAEYLVIIEYSNSSSVPASVATHRNPNVLHFFIAIVTPGLQITQNAFLQQYTHL